MATAVQPPLFQTRAETHLQRRVRYAQQYAMPVGSRCWCPDCFQSERPPSLERSATERSVVEAGQLAL
jgi:hypothetical protein